MAAAQAQKRNSRYISSEDLIFLIRHDRQKVTRLTEFLSWKDVRKNVKDREGEAADDIIEEADDKPEKARKAKVKLFWELATAFGDNIALDIDEEFDDDSPSYAQTESLKRLKAADEITRLMTRDEYVHYSECRQASFTYRKGKRFRDWVNMQLYIDMKANDDIIDILGFLTFEMVSKLTETALKIKNALEASDSSRFSLTDHVSDPPYQHIASGLSDSGSLGNTNLHLSTNSTVCSLFAGPKINKSPIRVEHIQEAYRQFQHTPQHIRNFRGGLKRTRVSLI
ncbi:SAGA complex subunit spt3 [Smittium mucronatum]|uniref:SAGA complex subunit spt3 n=1 Tax=Smittium mucronatum TaxID=133383 RepID=A0A1R0GU25_9FUNG|nr:SAGA complex subunit spt3 [Smittium mucronatum]